MQRVLTMCILLAALLTLGLLSMPAFAQTNKVVYLPLVMKGGAAPAPLPTTTAGPIPTNTPVPMTPVPTSAPSEVKILSSSSYVDSEGYLWIVGEVQNDTSQNVEFVEIVASLFDGDTLLVTESTYTDLRILRPGQRAPFSVLVATPPSGYDRYTLQVDWDTTTDQPPDGITILSHRSRAGSSPGSRLLEGEVRNDSGGPLESVEIVATMYNSAGIVVAVESGLTSSDPLAARQTSPFEIVVNQWNNAARYELQIQALRP
ncbi:MAG TPA: FxLYD domain-containing protein [Herpetosiphonaceae bacterium]|nr:FxLYD domain-containing protein [Herpetosiphonaceae bacterium]